MSVQMSALEEVMMFEVSDEALEASNVGGTAFASCPAMITCTFGCNGTQ